MKKKILSGLLVLGLLLSGLTACGSGSTEIATMVPTGTQQESSSLEDDPIHTVKVTTVDELLAALNSSTIIELAEGSYHLDQASDYGKDSDNPAYYWEASSDGYELVLNHLHDLTILGSDREHTCILTSPRYSNILLFNGCKRIHLEGFTAGHTEAAELCTGGVLDFSQCQDITLSRMGMFGCGITGLRLWDCSSIQLMDSVIFDCSLSGLEAYSSTGIRIRKTDFYTLGTPDLPATSILHLGDCQDVSVQDCSISENNVLQLLQMESSGNVVLQNTEFRANRATAYGFLFRDTQPVFENVTFDGTDLRRWYEGSSMIAADAQGNLIGNEQLPPVAEVSPENLPRQLTVHVSTADEFLNAIGPNREIILDAALLDLSAASDYGKGSGTYYNWAPDYDGPTLVIANVNNMTIRAEGTDRKAHQISAVPRYADVLSFLQCENITLSGFTAGHSQAPGECSGGVLTFRDCDQIHVDNCGLYGCGILGVEARYCSSLSVTGCDIYECSFGGISMWSVENADISGNTFRDLGGPNVTADSCTGLTCDVIINDYPYYN